MWRVERRSAAPRRRESYESWSHANRYNNPTVGGASNPTMERLDDQISWYSGKSADSQRWYKTLKVVTMTAGVLVPIVSTAPWGPPYLAAALGVVIVLSEGLQQINQFQANWISYRSTCEALKHEKFLYLGEAGPYAGSPNPGVLLAERVEGLVSQEHAKWVSAQEQASKKTPAPR